MSDDSNRIASAFEAIVQQLAVITPTVRRQGDYGTEVAVELEVAQALRNVGALRDIALELSERLEAVRDFERGCRYLSPAEIANRRHVLALTVGEDS